MRALYAGIEARETRIGESRSPICSKCKAFFDNWYDIDNWSSVGPGAERRHHDIVGLRRSARNGCPVCSLLLRGLDREAIEELLQKRPEFEGLLYVDPKFAAHRDAYGIRFKYYAEEEWIDAPIHYFDSWETETDAFPSGRFGVNLAVSLANSLEVGTGTEVGRIQDVVGCEENWTLVKKWLSIYKDTHIKYSQSSFNRQLPTRLIEVGRTDLNLKLCLIGSLPRETQYLTLSYCWGGKVFTTLTRSNFQEFLLYILTASFSKTFREVIITIRRLGFKYL